MVIAWQAYLFLSQSYGDINDLMRVKLGETLQQDDIDYERFNYH